jgi:hypothetical protein
MTAHARHGAREDTSRVSSQQRRAIRSRAGPGSTASRRGGAADARLEGAPGTRACRPGRRCQRLWRSGSGLAVPPAPAAAPAGFPGRDGRRPRAAVPLECGEPMTFVRAGGLPARLPRRRRPGAAPRRRRCDVPVPVRATTAPRHSLAGTAVRRQHDHPGNIGLPPARRSPPTRPWPSPDAVVADAGLIGRMFSRRRRPAPHPAQQCSPRGCGCRRAHG